MTKAKHSAPGTGNKENKMPPMEELRARLEQEGKELLEVLVVSLERTQNDSSKQSREFVEAVKVYHQLLSLKAQPV